MVRIVYCTAAWAKVLNCHRMILSSERVKWYWITFVANDYIVDIKVSCGMGEFPSPCYIYISVARD